MEFDSKLQRQRTNELVLEQMMTWIMDGTLAMGQKINTEQIAKQLGVSRMPVREATASLEKMGLAESVPFVGYRLITLNESIINDLYLIRRALEPLAAFYACQNMTTEALVEIESIQQQLERVIQDENCDPKEVFTLNREFHFAIYQTCGKEKVFEFIQNVWRQLSFCKLIYANMMLQKDQMKKNYSKEHRLFIELLRKRDAEGLKQAVYDSLGWYSEDVPKQMMSVIYGEETSC